jgi:hypothetical protein
MKIIFRTIIAFTLIHTSLFAQTVPIEVKKIDLSGNGKNKNSKIVGCEYNAATKTTKLSFASTICEGSESKSSSSRSFVADGLKYSFEYFNFNESFDFVKLDKEDVSGLRNALLKAPVLGQQFLIESPYGYVPGADRKGGWLTQYNYATKVYASTRYGFFTCNETIEAKKGDITIPFSSPPESVLSSHPVKDGVMVLTQNSQSETTVNARFFDHTGAKKAESTFKISYGFAARVLPFKTANGITDLILILQPTEKFNKYGIKIDVVKSNPLEFEFIRIDGSTMQLKDRFTFNAINTQWYVEQVVENNGALYLLGQSSNKIELCSYGYGAFGISEGGSVADMVRIDKLENYQVMKIQGGKMVYINAFTPADMAKVETLVPGAKGSNDASGYFRLQEVKIVNDKIYITGQNTKPGKSGDDRKQEFLMMLSESGKLSHLFYVPKSNYANSNMFFSEANKSLIWAIYDYSEYEITATRREPTQIKLGFLVTGDDHTFMGKVKNDDGPQLQLVKFDLATNTPSSLQICGKDEYTLFDDYPVLYSNGKEIVFFGVSGKNKERFVNVIRAKF